MEIPKHLTYDFIWTNRDRVKVIYEGNILGRYLTGFAKKVEGLPNVYPIPTRRSDCEDERVCYLHDNMYDLYKARIDNALIEIPDDSRETIITPKFGLGRAAMDSQCPRLYEYLISVLKNKYGYTSS